MKRLLLIYFTCENVVPHSSQNKMNFGGEIERKKLPPDKILSETKNIYYSKSDS